MVTIEYGKLMGKPLRDNYKKNFRRKIELLGVDYPTLDCLKAVFQALIINTKNDDVIEEPDRSQVMTN